MSPPLQHRFATASRHRTSDGVLVYRRCPCGTWRICLEPAPTRDFLVPDGCNRDVLETVAQPFRAATGAS